MRERERELKKPGKKRNKKNKKEKKAGRLTRPLAGTGSAKNEANSY
jgi:hypothetical protein